MMFSVTLVLVPSYIIKDILRSRNTSIQTVDILASFGVVELILTAHVGASKLVALERLFKTTVKILTKY